MRAFLTALMVVAGMIAGGCATSHVEIDAKHPPVALSASGRVTFLGRILPVEQLPAALYDAGISRSSEIDILVDDDVNDPRIVRHVMATLARAGYRRPICITKKKSKAYSKDGKDYSKMAEQLQQTQRFNENEKVYYIGY